MRHLLKNERFKYGLMIIGAITVLSGIVIGAYSYLTSQTYSQEFEFLGGGGQNLAFNDDESLKTLVKKQVLSSLDGSGYLTEEDLKEVMSDELYNKVISDVKDRVDTSIANEVASAVDESSLSDAQIKAIVDREVQNYINSNSDGLSEISKIKEQITALKKADSSLSTQIASSKSTATAGKDGKQGAKGEKGEKGDPGMTAAEVSSVKSTASTAEKTSTEAKTAAEAAKTTASEAKDAAAAAKTAAEAAASKKSGEFKNISTDENIVHMKWISE